MNKTEPRAPAQVKSIARTECPSICSMSISNSSTTGAASVRQSLYSTGSRSSYATGGSKQQHNFQSGPGAGMSKKSAVPRMGEVAFDADDTESNYSGTSNNSSLSTRSSGSRISGSSKASGTQRSVHFPDQGSSHRQASLPPPPHPPPSDLGSDLGGLRLKSEMRAGWMPDRDSGGFVPVPPVVMTVAAEEPEFPPPAAGWSGDEAVWYMRDHAFSVYLDVGPVAWPSYAPSGDVVTVSIPGSVLQASAMQQAQALYADNLIEVDQVVPPMSMMKRWFPFRVSLVRAYSNGVRTAWGVGWMNSTMNLHNKRRWGTGAHDVGNLRDEKSIIEQMQHNFLWLSPRHRLLHDYCPPEPLVLSDLSPLMESKVFRHAYINVDEDYARSVQHNRRETAPDQSTKAYKDVQAKSHLAYVLQKDFPEFREWAERNPAVDGKYVGVPESLCEQGKAQMRRYMSMFIGYTDFLSDQVFRFVALPRTPPRYEFRYASESSSYHLMAPAAAAAAAASSSSSSSSSLGMGRLGPPSIVSSSLQDRAELAVPEADLPSVEHQFSSMGGGSGGGSGGGEIMLTLKIDICPCRPMTPEEEKSVGKLQSPGSAAGRGVSPPY